VLPQVKIKTNVKSGGQECPLHTSRGAVTRYQDYAWLAILAGGLPKRMALVVNVAQILG
jgi:hypothetical protein